MSESAAAEVDIKTDAPEDENSKNRNAIDAVKANIDVNNQAMLSTFGRDAKGWIAEQSDAMLRDTLNKDSDFVGDLLMDLNDKVSGLDPSSLQNMSFLKRMMGGTKKAVKRFVAKFDNVANQVDDISHRLVVAKENLRTDIFKLDQLYDQNVKNIEKLNVYVVAGEEYIQDAKGEIIPRMKAEAEAAADSQMASQNVFDFTQALERFERLLHDLKLSKTMALQMLPQIRMVQSSSTSLVDKLNSSIDIAIPAWKNQMVMGLALSRQKQSLKLQQDVSDMTNTLLKKNAEMLKTNTIEIEKETQRGIVDINTLTKVNEDLLSTIHEVLEIQKEGRLEREKAEVELQSIEGQLAEVLAKA